MSYWAPLEGATSSPTAPASLTPVKPCRGGLRIHERARGVSEIAERIFANRSASLLSPWSLRRIDATVPIPKQVLYPFQHSLTLQQN